MKKGGINLATQQAQPKNKSKSNKVLLIILLLFIIMIITTMTTYFVAKNIIGKDITKSMQNQNQNVTYSAGDFLTNLKDRGYIKLSLVYLLHDKDTEKELEVKDCEIRDKILTILRSKSIDEVRDSKGMEELRKLIKQSINDTIDGEVVDVFFTSIIVN